MGGLLANQLVRGLGAPVFVAYLAEETQRADSERLATEAALRQMA